MMNLLGCSRGTHIHGKLGGMELSAKTLYEAIASHGTNVTVVSSSLTDGQSDLILREEGGVRYAFLPNCPPMEYSTEYHAGIRRYFSELMGSDTEQLDVIHSTSAGGSSLCRNSNKVPIVATWHGTFIEQELDKLSEYVFVKKGRLLPSHLERVAMDFLMPFALNNDLNGNYDRHVALSEFMKKALTCYGIADEIISVVPNSVDDRFFGSRELSQEQCRELLKIDIGDRILLGVVGRGVPAKGYSLLYEAMKELDPEKFALLIVGGGGDDSDIPTNLPVLRFTLPHTQMQIAYRAMDVFVNPTLRLSGFDMTIQESLACGVKTIVSDTSQYEAFYRDYTAKCGPNATLGTFRVGDTESLANSIKRMVVKNVLPDADRQYLAQAFGLEAMRSQYSSIFAAMQSRSEELI